MGALILTLIGMMIVLAYRTPINRPDVPVETTLLFLGSYLTLGALLATFLRQAALRAFENLRFNRPDDMRILLSLIHI